MKRFYTIPIFIPEKACPHRCIYCNQYNISDCKDSQTMNEVKNTIEKYLKTFPKNGIKKIGFFGGNFTGMTIIEQNQYLDMALPYIKAGAIDTIQLSTRPDYISNEILVNLKEHHIETIELGAQSLDPEVLAFSRRGHTLDNIRESSAQILSFGFHLGLQMMIGLPKDSIEKCMFTASQIVELGAHCTRIYPTLVIKNTDLEKLYKTGKYYPLTLDESILWSKKLFSYFIQNEVTILRMGLHPSEGLLSGENLVAGPFHVSYKELVLSSLWQDYINEQIQNQKGDNIIIYSSPKSINYAVGYNASNKKMLLEKFKTVVFKQAQLLTEHECKIDIY
ncbi:MAG: radical SAM protein [Bacteroidales bacterium]|jgi:histone acetyltransferase (RNA polymerase elongator complex component)|nr:radical SAM protein [Bacteroidales bacterium]